MKTIRTIIISAILSLLIANLAQGQDKTVQGKVTAENEPLPGVSVVIKGTQRGSITDASGVFEITATSSDTLVFSFVGYQKKQVPIGSRTNLQVILQPSVTELEEVVAIGYGSVKKKDLTGAVSTVKGESLEKRNVSNLQQALSGQLAGVQVTANGGEPGAGASVLVRGISTINGNDPLYVVDGMPISDIGYLDPRNIASIQVLKDASAAAIYGSRASNGVVIIETKGAEQGQTNITFSGTYSMQNVANQPNLANATEYARIQNEAAENDGQAPVYSDPASLGEGTDWWDLVTQTAPMHNYNLTYTKGAESYDLSSSLSYDQQDGVIKGDDYERISFRLKSNADLTERLNVGASVTIAKTNETNGPGLVWDVTRAAPVTPVYLQNYEQTDRNQYSIYAPTITDVANPMGQLARSNSTTDYFRTVGDLNLNYEFFEGLNFKSKFGVYLNKWENNWFTPNYYIEETDKQEVNSVGRTHNNRTNYTWNNTLTYDKSFGDHSIKAMAGATFESFEHRTLDASGDEIPSNHPNLRYLSAATDAFYATGLTQAHTLMSYLGRVNYDYAGKYLLTASLRADASSRFPEDNKWGYFPSASFAWVASQEDFLKDVSWLSQLKMRVGWGQLGNQNIPNSARITTLGNTYYSIGQDQHLEIGTAPNNIGNQQLKWETVEDINVGLDLALFNRKIIYSLDVFKRNSEEMLMAKSVPLYMGSGFTRQWANVGSLTTQGFEMSLKYQNDIDDFHYSFDVNITSAHSEMTTLANGEALWDGNHQRLNNLGYTAEGETAGSFYGYVTDGIFQNKTEVNSHSDEHGNLIQPNAKPGDFRFKDLNGDGQLTSDDRKIIGNPEPDFSYGLNMYFEYKNFDLSALFSGSYGNDMLNAIKPYIGTGSGSYNMYADLLDEAWDGEGSTDQQPRLSDTDLNQNFRYSDYYVEDGSYLRLKNIQVGYTLPQSLSESINISRAKVFVGAENLFTLTSFSGLDPEIGGSATLRGVDWGHYPLPRIFNFGINMNF